MADKFELNADAVNASISNIAGAINGLGGTNIKIECPINNTPAFNEYKSKVDVSKTVITSDFPTQLQSALRSIGSKVEALKDMEQKLKEMIQTQSSNLSQNEGQGGSQGFR